MSWVLTLLIIVVMWQEIAECLQLKNYPEPIFYIGLKCKKNIFNPLTPKGFPIHKRIKDKLVLGRVKSTSGTVGAEGVKDCAHNNRNQRCEKHEICSASQSDELSKHR